MTKDLIIIGGIYTSIIFGAMNIHTNHLLNKQIQETELAKIVAIQLDEDLTNMEQNVISLNAELDNVQTTIDSYSRIQRIQKDIARLWDRR